MTSRELIRWQLLHERRSRAGWWTSPWVIAIVAGAILGGFVAWRIERGSVIGASHVWLAGAIAAYALAFMRVPFHLYWRQDAALLAQLPIEGSALLDAALVRAVRAAAATTLAVGVAALPLANVSSELGIRHGILSGTLFLAAGLLLPGVATWAAWIVAYEHSAKLLGFASAVGGAPPRPDSAAPSSTAPGAASPQAPDSSALLGALPGTAAAGVIVMIIIVAPWLTGGEAKLHAEAVLAILAGASVLAVAYVRGVGHRAMGPILRDVSALDRQRLATLEIREPTAIERTVGRLLGDGGIVYRKDARLMRRRYPMAFALGALAFLVLAIVGFAVPADPTPYLIVVVGGTAIYGVVLAGRLQRPPIELVRLAATLPIEPGAIRRAKIAWLIVWWIVFVLAIAAFALLRNRADLGDVMLLALATVVVAVSTRARRDRLEDV